MMMFIQADLKTIRDAFDIEWQQYSLSFYEEMYNSEASSIPSMWMLEVPEDVKGVSTFSAMQLATCC